MLRWLLKLLATLISQDALACTRLGPWNRSRRRDASSEEAVVMVAEGSRLSPQDPQRRPRWWSPAQEEARPGVLMGLKNKLVVWFLKRKLEGGSMLKWLRKYPVLIGVAIVAIATILRAFGQAEWAEMLSGLSKGLGLTLADAENAPVTGPEVAGAVAAILGVITKLVSDAKKRKAAKNGNSQGNT